MATSVAVIGVLLGLGGAGGAAGRDCDMTAAFKQPVQGGTRPVSTSADGALLYTGPLALNFDGAPNAYHPLGMKQGHALDTICNGANAILPNGTRLRGDTQCPLFYAAFEQARDAGWLAPGKPRIEWYGVAKMAEQGDDRWRPCIQATGPFTGFFVAQTALAADPSKAPCDPARYIDSTQLSFVVLPKKSGFLQRDLGLGSVGAAYYAKTGRIVPTIVGDVGPANQLGEGSLALARGLRGEDLASQAPPSAIAKGVTVVLFPDRKIDPPIMPARIAAVATERLAAWGGPDRLKACAEHP